MDDRTITVPLTPAKLGRAVSEIVQRAIPMPRQENCMAVGQMERELTALCGEAVQVAYDDAGRDIARLRDDNERLARELAEAKEHLAHDRQAVATLRDREQQAWKVARELRDEVTGRG